MNGLQVVLNRTYWALRDLMIAVRVIILLFASVGVYRVYHLSVEYGWISKTPVAYAKLVGDSPEPTDYPDNFKDPAPMYRPVP